MANDAVSDAAWPAAIHDMRGHNLKAGLRLDVIREPGVSEFAVLRDRIQYLEDQLRWLLVELHASGTENIHVNAAIAKRLTPHMGHRNCGCDL